MKSISVVELDPWGEGMTYAEGNIMTEFLITYMLANLSKYTLSDAMTMLIVWNLMLDYINILWPSDYILYKTYKEIYSNLGVFFLSNRSGPKWLRLSLVQ